MRIVLSVAAALAATVAALAAPVAGAHVQSPGPQCGGTLWKLMTLSDTGKNTVAWSPTATTIPAVANLVAPPKIGTARSTAFQKHVWSMTAVIERYRMASNGEIVLELFDVPSSTYMDAYLPAAQCLPTSARGRSQMLAARNSFLHDCPAASNEWQMLGATANIAGVGYFNPVKTTIGALKNGAELRPLVSLGVTQGCGHF
jgi:hypothetical protein